MGIMRSKGDLEDPGDGLEKMLERIRVAYKELDRFDRGKLFTSYYSELIEQLTLEVEVAAGRQSLDVTPRGNTTRPLLGSLTGEESDCCLFVHHLDNNEFLVSHHSRDFVERIFAALLDGNVRHVRRLFVAYGRHPLEDAASRKLAALHQNLERADFRIISVEEYEGLTHDEGFLEEHLDFGVYGTKYVYVSNQRPADRRMVASGTFIASKADVQRYTDVFESAWVKGAEVAKEDSLDPSIGSCRELFEGLDEDRNGQSLSVDRRGIARRMIARIATRLL